MIDLGTPPVSVDGVTVFAGYGPSSPWYFLPLRPRLCSTIEGKPDLSLVKFRGEFPTDAGGILRLGAELSARPDVVERAAASVRSVTGTAVSVAPVKAESVRSELLVWAGSESRLSSVAASASNEIPYEAHIEARLPREAATLYGEVLRLRSAPGVLIYYVLCKAMRPSLAARITMDRARITDAFTERFGGARDIRYRRIVDAIRAVIDDGLIQIDSRADLGGDPGRVSREVERLLLNDLFDAMSPSLGDADLLDAPRARSAEQLGIETRTYALKVEPPAGRVTLDLSEPAEVPLVLASFATVSEMLEPFPTSATSDLVSVAEQASA